MNMQHIPLCIPKSFARMLARVLHAGLDYCMRVQRYSWVFRLGLWCNGVAAIRRVAQPKGNFMATSKKRTSNKATKATPAAPAKPTANVATPAAQAQTYKLADKAYNPRATTMQGNADSWAAVQAFMAANGGKATLGQLQAHLAEKRNHGNFAKYAIRRGWLVATK